MISGLAWCQRSKGQRAKGKERRPKRNEQGETTATAFVMRLMIFADIRVFGDSRLLVVPAPWFVLSPLRMPYCRNPKQTLRLCALPY
jgi:hypothetical protein